MKKLIFILLSFILTISACKKEDETPTLVAPVAIDASDITNESFTAKWNTSSGATDYEMDVATDQDFANIVKALKFLGSSSTVVDGLEGNTEYFYRLRATLNGGSPSGNSNTINVYTLPDAPVATEATNITSDGFTSNWDGVDGITNYVLYISQDNFTSDPPIYVPGYDGAVVDGTTHSVTGLESGTIYYYAVRANADARVSVLSNSIVVETTH